MLKFFSRKSKEEEIKKEDIKDKVEDKVLELNDAMDFIQEKFLNSERLSIDYRQRLQSFAMAGDKDSRDIVKDEIRQIIKEYRIKVSGYSTDELVNAVFADRYGLKSLQKYYEDPTVDEIRVNSPDNIRIVIKGIPYKVDEKLNSEEEIENIIKRLIMEDIGVALNKSNPTIESVLMDGSRLTATCFPVSKSWNFILRKHDSFELTLDNYIATKTLDRYTWDMLSVLARGGAKMLFSGNVGAGKTTLMKKVIGELNENLRIGVIGTDIEVNLQEHYPDRDIVELEEQAHLGITMKELFSTMLRESIDVLVVEEFRGSGEAIEAVRACTRGLPNAFTTAHFNNPEEAIEGTALFMLEEGLNLELDLAKVRVARAFNIVVQLFGDAISGKKKLISITEVIVDKDNNIIFNDLLRWEPSTDEYLGDGTWKMANQPSSRLLSNLLKRLDRKEVEKLGWDTSKIKL